MTRGAVLLALLALAGCFDGSPTMQPGDDCLGCHNGDEARTWTVAGTVGKPGLEGGTIEGGQGAKVAITDANGRSFTVRANKVGNFYTAEKVAFPLRVSVDGVPMGLAVTDGSCNRCHGNGPGSGGETGGG